MKPETAHPAAVRGTACSSPAAQTGTATRAGTAAGVIRVLLADDHAAMRQGLALLLNDEPGIRVVGEAADGEAAVEMARRLEPDVVVMDVGMPRLNGVEAARRIASELPAVHIIALSSYTESDMGGSMRAAGAAAYVTKGAPWSCLVEAIRRVAGRTRTPAK